MKILLGITGSVAATLTPKLVVTILKIPNVELRIIATERSQHFFKSDDLPVRVFTNKDEWPVGGYTKGEDIPHIDLGVWADLLLIAPLTADTLSDMAHGKADKFLTSVVLAWPQEKPMVLAPAMNTRMWTNLIVKTNVTTVRQCYRCHIIDPVEGHLACNTTGIGAMANIDYIVSLLSTLR